MERYDPGLKIIASAQQAREAGDYGEAHAQFVKGIEQLMKLVQQEQHADTKSLVRKHVVRFMEEAEQMVAAQVVAAQDSKSQSAAPRPAAKDAESPEAKKLRAVAQGVEKRARDAERGLKFVLAFNSYSEAAGKYKALRQEAAGNDQLRTWAGERALAMLDGAERLKKFIQRDDSSGAGDNILNLPHVPGSAAASDEARMPENFAKPDAQLPNTLPNSLTETFVRGRTNRDSAEGQVHKLLFSFLVCTCMLPPPIPPTSPGGRCETA